MLSRNSRVYDGRLSGMYNSGSAIYGLYGPPTKFQHLLTKLVQKSAVSVYSLAQLAEVDEGS